MASVQESYKTANVKDYLDQHLDMETAILRLQLEHNETLEKFMHHTKLVAGQIGKILDGIPTYVTNPDGSLTTLIEKDDMDLLKKMSKQLDIFKLSDSTPELERDIYIYTFAHNVLNAYTVIYPFIPLNNTFLQVLSIQALQLGRAMAEMYWQHTTNDFIADLLGEHGYTWEFIDPNGEVEKVSEADGSTRAEARAKIMQRSINGMYDKTLYTSENYNRLTNSTWFSALLEFAGGGTNVYEIDVFIEGMKKHDPSRYLIGEEETT